MHNDPSGAFTEAVSRYRKILIFIPGSPDPDALASSYAIRTILDTMGIGSEIVSEKKISLPQNRAFVKSFSIPLVQAKTINPERFDSYIITDFQSNVIEGITGRIPCAVHIDHHEKSHNNAPADFSYIRTESGSTSALVAHILKGLSNPIPPDRMTSIFTALIFGIQTDTDSFRHASKTDMEALKFLSLYADNEKLNSISAIPISRETMLYYKTAGENELIYKDWAIYGIGYLDISHRDSLAITADLLLKNRNHKAVAVFAIVEDRQNKDLFIDVSFRTDSPAIDLNTLIKKITPTGGGRRFKGAYQIKMKYFNACPDREILWRAAESTTIARIKEARDAEYITEIKNITRRAIDRFAALLKHK